MIFSRTVSFCGRCWIQWRVICQIQEPATWDLGQSSSSESECRGRKPYVSHAQHTISKSPMSLSVNACEALYTRILSFVPDVKKLTVACYCCTRRYCDDTDNKWNARNISQIVFEYARTRKTVWLNTRLGNCVGSSSKYSFFDQCDCTRRPPQCALTRWSWSSCKL